MIDKNNGWTDTESWKDHLGEIASEVTGDPWPESRFSAFMENVDVLAAHWHYDNIRGVQYSRAKKTRQQMTSLMREDGWEVEVREGVRQLPDGPVFSLGVVAYRAKFCIVRRVKSSDSEEEIIRAYNRLYVSEAPVDWVEVHEAIREKWGQTGLARITEAAKELISGPAVSVGRNGGKVAVF